MSRLALYLLGMPRLELDGQEISLPRRKALALLAYLAVTGRDHSRDTLATLLWPEYGQSRARASLRSVLTLLRQTLGESWLEADRETVGLDAGSRTSSLAAVARADVGPGSQVAPGHEFWLDVAAFQHRLTQCRTHGHRPDETCPACLSPLAEAAALYRDDFLSGFTLRDSPNFDDWQFFQTEGLRRELAGLLQRLVLGLGLQGEFVQAIPYARRWVALDPLHEPAHRHLMGLYAWSGQRAAALRQYAQCERVLHEELGVPPEGQTAQLYEAIQAKQERMPSLEVPVEHAVPATAQTLARGHNLPAQLTPFVGREAELVGLDRLLSDPDVRLVTVLGMGGMGKTRLALEAAARQLDHYPHGVYWVSLAPLRSVEAIVPTVASALGYTFYSAADSGAADSGAADGGAADSSTGPRRQLLDYLRPKSTLLLFDNVEHLLPPAGGGDEGAADLVSDILQAAPGVRILATSRASLNVQEEHLFHIAGLECPGPMMQASTETPADAADPEGRTEYSALRLFVQSARRVRPGFALQADDRKYISRICRLVQGMPLGILLAAAWVEMLSPEEIARELAGGEGQSLDFLATDLRNVPERQRSIRAVFDHSWSLLTVRERGVMEALSAFRGGCTREAAQRVTGVSLRELMALVRRSLLQRTAAPSVSHADVWALRTGGRFEMHELLRQYAAEKLDRSSEAGEAVRDRHCAYYTSALRRWAADLKGPRQQAAMAEIEADVENARAAWEWAVERGQAERLGQAMEGLGYFYDSRALHEEGASAFRIAADRLAGWTNGSPGASAGRLLVQAQALTWQGYFRGCLNRHELARDLLRQSMDLLDASASADTRRERAYALFVMGWIEEYSGNLEKAGQLYTQSLALYRALDQRWEIAYTLDLLGKVVRRMGEYDQAKGLHQESLAIQRELGDQRGIFNSLLGASLLVRYLGQFEEDERLSREALAIAREMGDRVLVFSGLYHVAGMLMWKGESAESHLLAEEGLGIANDLGAGFRWACSFLHSVLGMTMAQLGQYEGARVHMQQALALAQEADDSWQIVFAFLGLGLVALAEGNYAEARAFLQKGIAIVHEMGQRSGVGWFLAMLAGAACGLGRLAQAREHLCEALQLSHTMRNALTPLFALPVAALFVSNLDPADMQRIEWAVEIYALACRYGFVAHSRLWEDIAGRHIAAAAAFLPPDVVAAAQARGRARDLWITIKELLVELEAQEGTNPG